MALDLAKTPHIEKCCGLCRISLDHVGVALEGETLLQDVNLHIHCGQLTVLIGPNGGGKTTLLRTLLGQIPHTGEVRHRDTAGRPFPQIRTGYVPQQLPFDRQMPVSVLDLIACEVSRRPVWTGVSPAARKRVHRALAAAQAEGLADKRLGALSGGELQRVLLSLALTPTPDLLVLDEPVSGVDQNGQALFLESVRALRNERHIAIVMVSHDWDLVRQFADHVALVNKTVLIAGPPEEVFSSPAFAEAFPATARSGRLAP